MPWSHLPASDAISTRSGSQPPPALQSYPERTCSLSTGPPPTRKIPKVKQLFQLPVPLGINSCRECELRSRHVLNVCKDCAHTQALAGGISHSTVLSWPWSLVAQYEVTRSTAQGLKKYLRSEDSTDVGDCRNKPGTGCGGLLTCSAQPVSATNLLVHLSIQGHEGGICAAGAAREPSSCDIQLWTLSTGGEQ